MHIDTMPQRWQTNTPRSTVEYWKGPLPTIDVGAAVQRQWTTPWPDRRMRHTGSSSRRIGALLFGGQRKARLRHQLTKPDLVGVFAVGPDGCPISHLARLVYIALHPIDAVKQLV